MLLPAAGRAPVPGAEDAPPVMVNHDIVPPMSDRMKYACVSSVHSVFARWACKAVRMDCNDVSSAAPFSEPRLAVTAEAKLTGCVVC